MSAWREACSDDARRGITRLLDAANPRSRTTSIWPRRRQWRRHGPGARCAPAR